MRLRGAMRLLGAMRQFTTAERQCPQIGAYGSGTLDGRMRTALDGDRDRDLGLNRDSNDRDRIFVVGREALRAGR